jgi:hypothetical protein
MLPLIAIYKRLIMLPLIAIYKGLIYPLIDFIKGLYTAL